MFKRLQAIAWGAWRFLDRIISYGVPTRRSHAQRHKECAKQYKKIKLVAKSFRPKLSNNDWNLCKKHLEDAYKLLKRLDKRAGSNLGKYHRDCDKLCASVENLLLVALRIISYGGPSRRSHEQRHKECAKQYRKVKLVAKSFRSNFSKDELNLCKKKLEDAYKLLKELDTLRNSNLDKYHRVCDEFCDRIEKLLIDGI